MTGDAAAMIHLWTLNSFPLTMNVKSAKVESERPLGRNASVFVANGGHGCIIFNFDLNLNNRSAGCQVWVYEGRRRSFESYSLADDSFYRRRCHKLVVSQNFDFVSNKTFISIQQTTKAFYNNLNVRIKRGVFWNVGLNDNPPVKSRFSLKFKSKLTNYLPCYSDLIDAYFWWRDCLIQSLIVDKTFNL